MQKKFVSIFLIIVLLIANSLIVIADSQATFSVDNTTTVLGQNINVSINISNTQNAVGGSYNIVYDNSLLEFVSYIKGSAYGSNAPAVNTAYASNKLRVSGTGSSPLIDGILLTIQFRTKAVGTAKIQVENIKLLTQNAVLIPCESNSGTATIEKDTSESFFANDIVIKNSLNNVTDTLTTGSFCATADITNNTTSGETAVAYVVCYNVDNNISGIEQAKKWILGNSSDNLEFSFTASQDTRYVKIFLWNDKTMTPIYKCTVLNR